MIGMPGGTTPRDLAAAGVSLETTFLIRLWAVSPPAAGRGMRVAGSRCGKEGGAEKGKERRPRSGPSGPHRPETWYPRGPLPSARTPGPSAIRAVSTRAGD